MKDWQSIWLYFAGYVMVLAILFAIFFKHNEVTEKEKQTAH